MDAPFIEQVALELELDLTPKQPLAPSGSANHATAQLGAMPRPSASTMATVGQVVAARSQLDLTRMAASG